MNRIHFLMARKPPPRHVTRSDAPSILSMYQSPSTTHLHLLEAPSPLAHSLGNGASCVSRVGARPGLR